MKKTRKEAFTLIEIMLVLLIIWIILLLTFSLNFSTMSDRQKNEIFTNKIVSKIEEARNNALMWKSIKEAWTYKQEISESWIVEIWDWSLNLIWSWITFKKQEKLDFKDKKNEIFKINCWTEELNKVKIIFEGKNAKIEDFYDDSKCDNKYDLKIITKRNNEEFEILFDSVTTVINSKKI